jgi:hypothetical protein
MPRIRSSAASPWPSLARQARVPSSRLRKRSAPSARAAPAGTPISQEGVRLELTSPARKKTISAAIAVTGLSTACDFASISPCHDAWVVGDEPFIGVDFGGYAQYAKGT